MTDRPVQAVDPRNVNPRALQTPRGRLGRLAPQQNRIASWSWRFSLDPNSPDCPKVVAERVLAVWVFAAIAEDRSVRHDLEIQICHVFLDKPCRTG